MREPGAFLYGATTHACLNRLRDGRTRARLTAERGTEWSGVGGSEAGRPEGEVRVLLREAMLRLPRDLQEVAVYYYMDRMTQEEIAQVIGCSRRTVSDLLARMRRHFPTEVSP